MPDSYRESLHWTACREIHHIIQSTVATGLDESQNLFDPRILPVASFQRVQDEVILASVNALLSASKKERKLLHCCCLGTSVACGEILDYTGFSASSPGVNGCHCSPMLLNDR